MENIIGWLLLTVIPAFIAVVAYYGVKHYKKRKQEELDQWLKDTDERARALREAERQRQRTLAKNYIAPTAKTKSTSYTSTARSSTATTTSTASQPASDWSSDLLTTMIIADMLTNNKDTVAGTVTWKDDVPTIKETSSFSWGLDDSDSRKSASSTFSSSDSSSSWDSGSSSSDSGPSSDW